MALDGEESAGTAEPGQRREAKLSAGASMFLDIVRLAAAMVVVLGHLTQPEFSTGWKDLVDYAVDAVTAFFLLSGVVIRYVTVQRGAGQRERSLAEYSADRVSRMYSVVLPATLFVVLVEAVMAALHGQSAMGLRDLPHFGWALLTNLTFTSFVWHQNVMLDANSPMWSLSFECCYYALYGLYFYLRGVRRGVCVLALAIAVGPEVMTLFPLWVGGCLLYECFVRLRRLRARVLLSGLAVAALPLGVCLWGPWRMAMLRLKDVGAAGFHGWQAGQARTGSAFRFLIPRMGHGSVVSFNAYAWGAIFFVAMLVGLLVFDRIAVKAKGRTRKTVVLLAEATFPMYLFHSPIFRLVVAVVGHPLSSAWAKIGLLVGVFAVSVYLGWVLNGLKGEMRRRLRGRAAA